MAEEIVALVWLPVEGLIMRLTENELSNENEHDMRHEKLHEVTLPIGAPLLMQAQTFPWNGDGYLAGEVLRLRDAHGVRMAVETGTCLGVTAAWLGEHFDHVATCEAHKPFLDLARAFISDKPGSIIAHHGSSPEFVWTIADNAEAPMLFFLDAHGISGSGKEACPLLDELDAIAKAGVKPCIVIHDFQVPGTDFGFDRFPDSGYPFSLEAIAPHLDRIYGKGGWKHAYPTKVEGARRGWISLEPMP